MDRLLRPERLSIEPTEPNAEKQYRHWKMTFRNYLTITLPEVRDAPAGDVAAIANVESTRQANELKKLYALQVSISHSIFELISDKTTYDSAFEALDNAFIKPTSRIYNRHRLMTSKQEPLQSVDTFLQELNRISKTCEFTNVTAEENRTQYVTEAFINGLSSAAIRQRLLENNTLTLDEAYKQARALEQAQTQAASYDTGTVASINMDNMKISEAPPLQDNIKSFVTENVAAIQSKPSDPCYFCKNPRHPRSKCPARNSECRKCGKKGHWAKACKSFAESLGAVPSPSFA